MQGGSIETEPAPRGGNLLIVCSDCARVLPVKSDIDIR
jgi:hypothetical protein